MNELREIAIKKSENVYVRHKINGREKSGF